MAVGVLVAVVFVVIREIDTGRNASRVSRSTTSSTTTTTSAPVPTTAVPRSADPVVALAQQYDGRYAGTWENTTARTSGPAVLELRVDPAASTMHVDVDFDGDLFGGKTKQVRRVSGAIHLGDPNAVLTLRTKAFGEVRARIDPSLAVVLTADAVPDPNVDGFELVGHLRDDNTGFDATFTIRFADGSRAEGIVGVDCDPGGNRPSEVQPLCAGA